MTRCKKVCNKKQLCNEQTKRCVLKSGNIGNEIMKNEKPKDNREKILNEKTGRWVLKEGKIGKILLKKLENMNIVDVSVKETLDDGNCFFSSLYRSLLQKNLLQQFLNCYKLKISKEESFIKSLRYLVANNSENSIKSMLDWVISVEKDASKLYFKNVVLSFGDLGYILLFYKRIGKLSKIYEKNIIKDIISSIKTDKKWVGNIEVDITTNLFKKCDINIKISLRVRTLRDEINKDLKRNKFANTLYLFNQSETHYEYI